MLGISHRVAETRSLALHHEVAQRLRSNPELLERARARIRAWSEEEKGSCWVEAWAEVLRGTVEEVIAAITDPTEEGRTLRQSTPFAGAIDAATRWRILRKVGAATELE